MKKIVSVFITILVVSSVYAAVPPKATPKNEQNFLYQQLTGQKTKTSTVDKTQASAEKALMLARQSKKQKDYILAIKRYNFILKYYAKTPQAKMALIDKSDMYKEMGLPEQAAYNQKRVANMINKLNNNKLSKVTPSQSALKKTVPTVKK